MATINGWGSNLPVEETKGGSGTATFATGDILYASSSNTLSKLAAGSDTEVLTLASGVPSWAAPGGGSDWTLITTETPTTGSSVTVTSGLGTAYDSYLIVWSDIESGTSATHDLGFSVDAGSNYTVVLRGVVAMDGASTNVFQSSDIEITESTDTTAPLKGYCWITLNKQAVLKPLSLATWGLVTTTAPIIYQGVLDTTADIDAIQFTTDGTYSSGTIKIFGQ